MNRPQVNNQRDQFDSLLSEIKLRPISLDPILKSIEDLRDLVIRNKKETHDFLSLIKIHIDASESNEKRKTFAASSCILILLLSLLSCTLPQGFFLIFSVFLSCICIYIYSQGNKE